MVCPEAFSADIANLGTAKRVALPLRMAWACTIHKSQGSQFDLMVVSLRNLFAEHQVRSSSLTLFNNSVIY